MNEIATCHVMGYPKLTTGIALVEAFVHVYINIK